MIDSKDYTILKQICMFSNEIWYVALYEAISLENGYVIYVLHYSERNKPTERFVYKKLGIAYENFLKKVNI